MLSIAAQVKQTAFLALLSLLDFFPAAERIKRVIPEFLNMVESQPEYLVLLMAEHYGVLVTKLATLNHLGSDNAPAFLQSYAKLCSRDDIQIRQHCAYNFPAIVKAFGGSYVPLLMDDLLVKLCNDPVEKVRPHDDEVPRAYDQIHSLTTASRALVSAQVRHHVAAGIHEIVTLLGQQRAQRYVKPLFITLLKDDSSLVQGAAISRVPHIMNAMFGVAGDEDTKVRVLSQLGACCSPRAC